MLSRWLVRIWLILAVLVALGLAGTYFAGPDTSAPEGWTLGDELTLTGAKWIALAVVLAAAALLADNRTLAWILTARAVFDFADAMAAFGVGYAAVALPALVMTAFSAGAAWWLFRHADQPPILRPRNAPATAGSR